MSRIRVAVLIDLANISGAFDILKKARSMAPETRLDFNKFVSAITLGSEVVAKSIYAGTRKNGNEGAQYRFFDFFRKSGFNVVNKECKTICMSDGSSKIKANFDVEITVDTCCYLWKRECDEVILVSGDSDFAYLLDKAKELDFQITVVSSNASLSHELRERANRLILLDDLDLEYLTLKSRRNSVENGAAYKG